MQTLSTALIDLVVAGHVDRETAANAATNRHDFLILLERAEKARAVEDAANGANAPLTDETNHLPKLRLIGTGPAEAPAEAAL
jgi:hypothetical protein